MPQFITWPRNHEHTINICQQRSHGFPGVVGAIDGCPIPIKQPANNGHDYYNRKQFHSIILQGVCDHRLRFINIHVGMPGRVDDARVLWVSPIYENLTNNVAPLLADNQHILDDTAYPLMNNLLTPFKGYGYLNVITYNYNYKLSSIRSIIERCFGRLKGKFRRLKYLDIDDPNFGTKIITAACVLHNFILIHSDNEDDNNDYNENIPDVEVLPDAVHVDPRDNRDQGVQKRNAISNLLSNL